MSIHLAVSNGTPRILRDDVGNLDREATIQRMAEHLVAAILCGGLDTSSDQDVIACLNDSPDRYHYRIVLDNYQEAIVEAKQTLATREMSRA